MAIFEINDGTKTGNILLKQENNQIPVEFYERNIERNEIPWHWQEGLEIGIVLSGEIEVSVEAERYFLKEGDGYFINVGALNACRQKPDSSGNCIIRSIVFDPRMEQEMDDNAFYSSYIAPLFSSEAFKGTELSAETPWHKEILRLMTGFWDICIEGKDESYEEAVALISQMIFLLSSHCAAAPRTISPKESRDAERIRMMLSYIDEHYREDLNVSVLSDSAEISESEAMRCFHNMLGTTPIQYVKNYRIRKAAEMLQVSDDKIVDIAIDCGFQDMSYFAKTFRESKGITPTDYREKFKK